MTFEEYLSNMKPGYTVDGGSEDHLIMHEMSQRALKITMELNNKYHTKEEIVQLALPYEILLQHASIVSCLCVFGISQSSLGRIMAQENLPSLITLEKICTALCPKTLESRKKPAENKQTAKAVCYLSRYSYSTVYKENE